MYDFELAFVRHVLALIDRRLARLEQTDDPDAAGSLDHANFMAGVGFATLQTYQRQ